MWVQLLGAAVLVDGTCCTSHTVDRTMLVTTAVLVTVVGRRRSRRGWGHSVPMLVHRCLRRAEPCVLRL